MPGAVQRKTQLLTQGLCLAEINRFEILKCITRFFLIIKRQSGFMFCIVITVGALGILFLNMAAIRQQDFTQIKRGFGTIDRAFKSGLDQHGDIAAMIQMGMCQEQCINIARIDRQPFPVAQAQLLMPLKQSAINHDLFAAVFEQIFRSGHRAGCA